MDIHHKDRLETARLAHAQFMDRMREQKTQHDEIMARVARIESMLESGTGVPPQLIPTAIQRGLRAVIAQASHAPLRPGHAPDHSGSALRTRSSLSLTTTTISLC